MFCRMSKLEQQVAVDTKTTEPMDEKVLRPQN